MLMILLPIAAMAIVRYAGWLRMRKTDREIYAVLGPHHVSPVIDTFVCHGKNIVGLKTSLRDSLDQAILFIHGSPGSMDAYLDYMSDTSLLSRADLVTFDRPGFGNSGFGVAEPSLAKQAEIVTDLMDQLGYQHYLLVGHSYGAPIALQAAMRDPLRVSGLCLIAASISPALEPSNVSWRKWIDLPLLRDILPVSMRVSNEELMSLRQDLILLEDDWDALSMPVSIIHGSADALVPFANLDYARTQLIASDSVLVKVFPGESHFILWTHQQQVSQELVKLLELSEQ